MEGESNTREIELEKKGEQECKNEGVGSLVKEEERVRDRKRERKSKKG